MKSKTLTCITAMTLFAALAISVRMLAQELAAQPKKGHHRYKLVDLGTLGGPTSYESINGFGGQILNDAGTVSSRADTSIPDPNGPNLCFTSPSDCVVSHAIRWQDGVLTDLGALPGVNSSAAAAINARGWSVGQSQNGLMDPLLGIPEIRAVLWKDDQIIDLGTLGGNESLAAYVTDAGQVVAVAANAIPDPFSFIGWGTQTRAFLWEKGVMRDLGTLGGPDAIGDSGCRGNEHNGLVAGSSYTNSTPNPTTTIPTMHPFLWENGTMTDLGTLGGTFGTAQCVNNRRQVTGQSTLAGDSTSHPFFWDRGVLTDMGTLGGDNGQPFWLNDAGEAVGEADLPGGQIHHAFLWRNGTMTDLGSLGTNSDAFAINSKQQVVGRSQINATTVHAMIWEDGGPMIDLNTLIPANSTLQLVDANNINDGGVILGLGSPPGVVPDPESIGNHLVLLIPCGESDEGCEDNARGATAPTLSNQAPVVSSPTTSLQRRPTPRENVAAWRARLAQRYHIPGTSPRD
jgi:probable HAF family extracellular repeat protein